MDKAKFRNVCRRHFPSCEFIDNPVLAPAYDCVVGGIVVCRWWAWGGYASVARFRKKSNDFVKWDDWALVFSMRIRFSKDMKKVKEALCQD